MKSAPLFSFLCAMFVLLSNPAHPSSGLVDQPKNCFKALSEGSVCAVMVPSHSKIQLGESILYAKAQTSLLFHGRTKFEILAGEVMVQKDGPFDLAVKIFQEALFVDAGELLISRQNQQSAVDVVNLKAQVRFIGPWTAEQALPPGYQNWFAPGLRDPSYGVPRIYDSESVFRQVTAFWKGSKKDLVQRLRSYGELRRSAQTAAADSYQGLVRRHFASVEEDRLQEQRRQKALKAEKEKLRRLYRARVLDGEYTQPFD